MCAIQQSAALIAEREEFSTSLALRHNSCSWPGMRWVCLRGVWRLKGCQRLTSHREPPTHAHLSINTHKCTQCYVHRCPCVQYHTVCFCSHVQINNVNDIPKHHGEILSSKIRFPAAHPQTDTHPYTHPSSNWFRAESAVIKKLQRIQHRHNPIPLVNWSSSPATSWLKYLCVHAHILKH